MREDGVKEVRGAVEEAAEEVAEDTTRCRPRGTLAPTTPRPRPPPLPPRPRPRPTLPPGGVTGESEVGIAGKTEAKEDPGDTLVEEELREELRVELRVEGETVGKGATEEEAEEDAAADWEGVETTS